VFLAEPEPTSFDLRWRMFGVPVRVHPLFWLVSALLGWDLIEAGKEYLLIWVACVFFSILLHEMGHVIMGRIFGTRGHIILYGMGGLAVGSNHLDRRWQRILVSFAGPLIQLLFYFLLKYTLFLWLPHVRQDWLEHIFGTVGILLSINLFWPLLNLLPIWPLDGGMITREVCQGISRRRGVSVSLGISLVTAGALAAHGVLARIYGRPLIPYVPTGMFMILFFAMFAVSSYQALQMENYQRRQWEDDDWGWGR
jgi:Zn-dependent protease